MECVKDIKLQRAGKHPLEREDLIIPQCWRVHTGTLLHQWQRVCAPFFTPESKSRVSTAGSFPRDQKPSEELSVFHCKVRGQSKTRDNFPPKRLIWRGGWWLSKALRDELWRQGESNCKEKNWKRFEVIDHQTKVFLWVIIINIFVTALAILCFVLFSFVLFFFLSSVWGESETSARVSIRVSSGPCSLTAADACFSASKPCLIMLSDFFASG